MPATARYDRRNDSSWASAGATTTAATNTDDSVTTAFCGRSAATRALAARNVATARATDGDAPTRYR